jgi:uncharacterized protein YebE (UPF0316 family)
VIGDLNTGWNVVGYSLGYAVGTMLGRAREMAMGHVNIQIVTLARG